MTAPLYAALDIGTNSVLLLLARPAGDGSLTEVAELVRVTRLGEGVGHTRHLRSTAMERTLAAAADFLAAAQAHGAPIKGIAATTSAVRDADNRDEFLARCLDLFGHEPLILAGAEEARTIFVGATSDLPHDSLAINIDIGGGSTEIAAGTPSVCNLAVSLDLGCVRCAEEFELFETATPEQQARARTSIRQTLSPVCAEVNRMLATARRTAAISATGGTATTLAAVEQSMQTYDRTRVHGFSASESLIGATTARLFTMSSAARAELPGVPAGRAPVLPTGLLILSELMRTMEMDSVRVSTRGLRYGLARRLQSGDLAPTWEWERNDQ
jgi:exopolyphosphatase/guanosine-5'-triphosphate,3'-diphosphate pyrophosphatase